MPNESEFQDLIRRVRQGDEAAASDLVKDYEDFIRRAARFRLRDTRVRRYVDSLDICQAVLVSFFRRAADEQFELNSPEQLVKLLVTMARNKAQKTVRDQHAGVRDIGRQAAEPVEDFQAAEQAATPSQNISVKELIGKARDLMSDDEWQLLQMRNDGYDWTEVAEQQGGSPEALRKKLERALAAVRGRLEIGDSREE